MRNPHYRVRHNQIVGLARKKQLKTAGEQRPARMHTPTYTHKRIGRRPAKFNQEPPAEPSKQWFFSIFGILAARW